MSPQKTLAIVLTVLPYRESSCIMHLYTKEHGLVHGIAKGIRRQGKGHQVIERGFIIEALVYIHPHRTLHTLGSLAVAEFFPGIRDDLTKTAMRDALCELCAMTIHAGEQNNQLFEYLTSLLGRLDSRPASQCFPFLLWSFYYNFSKLLGFGLNTDTCLKCGRALSTTAGGILKADAGGVVCANCEPVRPGYAFIPIAILRYLNDNESSINNMKELYSAADMKKITRLLASYCRYHFESRNEYQSLAFVEEMIDSMSRSNRGSE